MARPSRAQREWKSRPLPPCEECLQRGETRPGLGSVGGRRLCLEEHFLPAARAYGPGGRQTRLAT